MTYLKIETRSSLLNIIVPQYIKMKNTYSKQLVKIIVLIFFSVFTTVGNAQISTGSVSTIAGKFDNFSTFPHNSGFGANRILIVGLSAKYIGNDPTGVTYNGINLTRLGGVNTPGALSEIYYLVNPPIGTYDVITSFPGLSNDQTIGATTFSGVDQVNPFGLLHTAFGYGSSNTLTVPSAVGELVYDNFSMKDEAAIDGPNQTELWSILNGSGSTQPGALSVDMSWSAAASKDYAHSAVSIKPAQVTSPATLLSSGDTHIQSLAGAEDYNYGAVDYMRTHPQHSVSLLKFDLNSIPSGAEITSAVLQLTEEYSVPVSEEEVIFPMTTPWEEGNGTGTDSGTIPGATWNDSDGTGPGDWVTGTFSASDYSTPSAGSIYVSSGNYTYSVDITSTVNDWLNGTISNEGLVIKRAESTGNYFLYSTREEAFPGYTPKLVITFTAFALSAVVTPNCTGSTIGEIDATVNGGTAPFTYLWADGVTTEDRTGLDEGNYKLKVTDANSNTASSTFTVTNSIPMSLSSIITPSSAGASNGAIDLTVGGGAAPFSISWSNGATTEDLTNLAGGSYTVSVTDACATTTSATYTVGQEAIKRLYLTDPTQGLDRIDPADVGTTDNSNSSTGALSADAGGSGTVLDNFDANATYAGNNSTGPRTWTTNWIENDIDGLGAGGGNIYSFQGLSMSMDNNIGDNVYRTTNLQNATAATLAVNITQEPSNKIEDEITLEVSTDGGSTYTTIDVYTGVSANLGFNYYDLINFPGLGTLTDNTVVRFRVSNTISANKQWKFDDVGIAYTIPASISNTSFTQGLPMCTDFTLEGGKAITVSTYATVVTGTIPSNPNVTAMLTYGTGPTNIITLSNPTWDGIKLSWTGDIPSNVTIPAGEAISLDISSSMTSGTFTIDYDSQTAPSQVYLPAITIINIDALNVYDAAYNGGVIITENFTEKVVYLRSVVSDPFGFYDITGLDYKITDPNSGETIIPGVEVASVGCTKTYEYAYDIPSIGGIYTVEASAREGTEGIMDNELITFSATIPVKITKTLLSPATGPYTINDNLTYNINIENEGTEAITTVPLQDIFDQACLEYVSASIFPDNIGLGTISWDDIGNLPGLSSIDVTATFKVVGNCDPARNIAKVEGAIHNFLTVLPATRDTLDINIDEAPVAVDDSYFISGSSNFQVLDNDFDADNDMTTLSIIGGGPSNGTATVNGLSISFNTAGMAENQQVTFTYQICDNASPTPYCASALVTVVYSAINNVPTLVDDIRNTTLNLEIIADVLENDSDIDGNLDVSTLSISTEPQFGTAEVNADGTITYRPNVDYFGTDQLIYMICDDGSPLPVECSTAVLDLTVSYVHYACKSSNSTLTVPPIEVADSYVWNLPVGAVIVSGGGTNSIVVDFSSVTANMYEICVEPSNFCGPGMERCVEVVVTDINIDIESIDALCKGQNSGAVNLTVTGGVEPYEYVWSNGSGVEDLVNLGAGLYIVTVTDRYGCSSSAGAMVSEPPTSVVITGAIVTAEDPYGSRSGSIDLSVSGGTPGYSYAWTDGSGELISTSQDPSALHGGTYTVVVTDSNGCTDSAIYTVNTVGGPLTISALLSYPVDCFGSATGSINLEIIGGSNNYLYDWSYDGTGDFDDPQDPINLTAGLYTVVIDDGLNPTVSAVVEVLQPTAALTASSVATNSTCFERNNGAIDATVSGGTLPYRYEWSSGSGTEDISGLTIGTYSLTVTDANNCIAVISETITEPSEIFISGILTENKCGPTDSGAIDLTVTGGNSPYSVVWSHGASTEDVVSLSEGIYSVIVTDNAGCTKSATFTLNMACIGVAKQLVGTPVNNGDGSYAIVYNITVENYGNIDLSSIQLKEDLSTTFSAATSFTLDAVSIVTQPSNPWTINSNFDGDKGDGDVTDALDDEVLSPLGILLVGESAVIRLETTVTPGSVLTYDNSANASGTTTDGKITTDVSQNGNDADPDNDGDPTNNNDPTPLTLSENPILGLAKVLGSTVTNNQDGTYSLDYNLRVENTGNIILQNIQVTDDIQLTFPGLNLSGISGSIVKQPQSSTLVYNSSYDGLTTGDFSLFDGLGSLAVGEYATIKINVTVEVDGSLGIFYNTATANGTSPAGTDVTDVSQDGTEVDPDQDGNPGNNSDPTPVSFLENPIVQIKKTSANFPISNSDGTHTVNYNLEVTNQGNVPIKNLQVTDDLNAAYPGLIISEISTTIISQPASTILVSNVNYDGLTAGDLNLLAPNGQLNVNEVTVLRVSLKVALDNSLGPFDNLATASGNGPGGTPTTDNDNEGTTLQEIPSIGFAKTVDTPVNNQDGSYSFNYTILVENTGNLPLKNILVKDDLSLTFAGSAFFISSVTSPTLSINGSYNGNTSGDIDLLAGSDILGVGQTGEIVISLDVIPGANFGPYYNSANGSGSSHGGIVTTDISQDGTDVDPDNDGDPTNNNDPTPVSFLEKPVIGLAKDIITDVVYNNNGTYSFTYEIRVENMGDIPLYNLQVVDDLAATYALATGFTVDGVSIAQQPSSSTLSILSSYNGDSQINLLGGSDVLNVGNYALIRIQLTVTPGEFGGPYNNTAIGFGTSPGGRTVVDLSQDGLDVDPDNDGIPTNNNDPTPVEFFFVNTTYAKDDYNQTLMNVPVQGNISTNDYDLENDNQTILTIAYDSDGNGIHESSVALPIFGSSTITLSGFDQDGIFVLDAGSITVNIDGTYEFTPTTGFTGTVSMRYVITDDNFFPEMDDALLVIDVTGPNINDLYPPVALNDNAITAPDVNVDIAILINDNDIDGFLVLASIDLDPSIPGIQVSYTTPGEGTFTVSHVTGLVTFDPEPTFIGTTTPIEYQVCDNDGLCDEALITVVIADYKYNTMYAEDDFNSGYSGEILTGNILSNDLDPDGSDGFPDVNYATLDSDGDGIVNELLTVGTTTVIYGQSANTPGMYVVAGTIVINSDGSYIYTSDLLFEGTVYVPYEVCDNDTDNACARATLYLATTKENSTVAEDDVNQTIVNIPVRGDVSTNDWDPEGDNQTVTSALIDDDGDGVADEVLGINSNATLYGVNRLGLTVVAGTILLNSDGTYDYNPATDFVGTVELIYTATDDNGQPASDDARLVIDVTGPNVIDLYPPIALDDNATTEPDVNVEIPVLDNDSDIDGVIVPSTLDLDPSVAGLQSTFTVANEGTYTIITSPSTSEQVVLFDPVMDFRGTTTPIDYKICDNDALCDEATITVLISDPSINEMSAEDDANSRNCSGGTLTGNILSNDIDPDGSTGTPDVSIALADSDGDGLVNDSLVLGTDTDIYSEDANNPGIFILAGTINLNSDGTYVFISDQAFEGTLYIPYTACDNDVKNACDNATLYLTIAMDNAIALNTGSSTLCIGETTNLLPSVAGTWTSSDPAIATVSNSGLVTAISGGLASFTYTSIANECAAIDIIEVSVSPEMAVAIDYHGSECLTENAQLSADLSGGVSPFTYSWTGPASLTANTQTIDIIDDGNYYLTITDAYGCEASTSGYVYNSFDPFIFTLSTEVCEGETVDLSVSAGTAVSYQWDANANNSTSQSVTVLPTTPSSSYVVTVTNDNGCESTATATIDVLPKDIVSITGPTSICLGETTTLSPNTGGIWESSNTNVATVTPSGVVTAVGQGNANFVFINDNTSCSSLPTSGITVKPLPQVSVTGPAIICIGFTTSLFPSSGGEWFSSDNSIATVTNDGTVTAVTSGTVTFTFKSNTTDCFSENTQTVTVSPTPTISVNGSDIICVGTTTLLSSSTGGSWTSSNAGIATVTSSGIVSGVSQGTVNLSFVGNNGCAPSASLTVTVADFVGVDITGDNILCEGESTTLLASADGGVWSTDNTNIATIDANGIVTAVAGGMVTILYDFNAQSCYSDATFAIEVKAKPIVNISGSTEICTEETTQVTTNLTNGTWTSSNENVAIVNSSGLVTGIGAGSTTFHYTSANGCVSNETVALTVNPPVEVAIDFNGSECLTAESQLSAIATGGTIGYTYSWTGPGGFTGTTQTIDIISDGNYFVTVTDGKGCTDMTTAFVYEAYEPFIFALNTTVCDGESVTLSVSGGGQANYLWSASAGSVTTQSVTVIPSIPSTSYTVSVTNAVGCITEATANIMVNSNPIVTITGSTDLCVGETTQLSPSTGGQYTSANASIASVTDAGLVTGHSNGSTTFTFVSDATGCASDPTSNINVVTNGTVTLTGDNQICFSENPTITASVIGGIWSSANPGVATIDSNGVVTPQGQGTTTINYDVPEGGCLDDGTYNITINSDPIISLNGPSMICEGDNTFANASTSGSWISSDVGIATISSTGIITGVSGGSATMSFVSLVGCTSTLSTPITIIARPQVILVGPPEICINSTTSLSPTTGGIWVSSNNNVASVSSNGTVTGNAPGTAVFSFIESANGCSADETITITVSGPPAINGLSVSELCVGETASITPSTGGMWFSTNESVATIENTGIITAVGAGSAKFIFTNSTSGCSSSQSSQLTVTGDPIINFTGPTSVCIGEQTSIAPTSGGQWISTNTSVATISQNGIITAVNSGTVTFIYTSNLSGCSSDPSTSLTIEEPTGITLTGPSTICVNESTTMMPNSGGTWSSSNANIATISNNGVIIGHNPGTVTFTYESDSGCTSNPSTDIAVLANTVVGFTGPSEICIGTTTNLSPSTGGTWSSSNTSVATVDNSGLVTAVGFGSADFTFVSTSSSCGSTTDGSLSVFAKPVPEIIGDDEICIGYSTTLTPSTGGIWTSSNTAIAVISPIGQVTGISQGTVTFTFYETGSNCVSDASAPVTVLPKTPVSIEGASSFCVGETTSVSPTTGGSWISNNPGVATVTNAGVVTGVSQGIAKFTFISDSGCASDQTSPILVYSPYSVLIDGPSQICVDEQVQLQPSSGGTWSTSDPLIATIDNNGVVTAVAPGITNFQFTSADTGCTSDPSDDLTVSETPVTSVNGPSDICIGSITYLTPSTGGIWSALDPGIATIQNNGQVTGIASGNARFVFTHVATGCESEVNNAITVNSGPAINFTGPTSICIGGLTNITSANAGTWISTNPQIATITNDGLITGVSSGSVKFSFQESGSVCVSDLSETLIVNGPPTVTVSGSPIVCIGSTTTLSPSTGGTWGSLDPSIATVTNAGVVTGLADGIANFQYTDNITGCISDGNLSVEVASDVGALITGDSEICTGYTTTLFPNSGGVWTSSNTAIAKVNNAGLVTGKTPGIVTFTFVDSGSGCSSGGTTDPITVGNCLNHDFNVALVAQNIVGDISTNDNFNGLANYSDVKLTVEKPPLSLPQLVINVDGTYSFVTDTPGKYLYKISVCIPPMFTACPSAFLEINVIDNVVGQSNPVSNLEFATTYSNSDGSLPGNTITVNPLANDDCVYTAGCNLDLSTLTIIDVPQNGSVLLSGTGSYDYTPNPGFIGHDTIVYEVCESIGVCSQSRQIVTVNASNATNSVVAADDFAYTLSGIAKSGNVSDNDIDPEGDDMTITSQGSLLNPIIIAEGSYYINNDGSYEFMPSATFSGALEIVYTVCDNNAIVACTNATLHIQVIADLVVGLRVYLEGSLMQNSGKTSIDGRPLMRDGLRVSPFTGENYIPVIDPYTYGNELFDDTPSKFVKMGPGLLAENLEISDSLAVFSVTGDNAIVDWIHVELRDKNDNTVTIATRSGLLQRDGDIVDLDGTSLLRFQGINVDSFYVCVRHRTHLGVMSMKVSNGEVVDFTLPTTLTFNFGTSLSNGLDYTGLSQKATVKSGYLALWAGDFNSDGLLKFTEPASDINILYGNVLFSSPQYLINYDFALDYFRGDYNMDGKAKYANPNDDRNYLQGQIIFHPLNTNYISNLDGVIQQIPGQ